MSALTVIVPAHDEEAVIAATLAPLASAQNLMRVIVVANGCRDATAERAREALPWAEVIELSQGGKANAINHGLASAPAGSVIVMDADIAVDVESLLAVAAALDEPGVAAASPVAGMDSAGADAWVRAYYRVFSGHDYLAAGVGGSGIYGLSAAGRERLGPLPAIIADDGYVRAFFPLHEQRRVTRKGDGRPLNVTVRTPHRVGELVRTEARWRAGDAQVRRLLPPAGKGSGMLMQAGGNLARSSAGRTDRAIYVAIKVMGRAQLLLNRARGAAGVWHRDTSSRGA